jgi:hypothetical protein
MVHLSVIRILRRPSELRHWDFAERLGTIGVHRILEWSES